MTRREWLAGLAAFSAALARPAKALGLVPLDEEAFRKMVFAHRGRPLLVDFWATWCAPCREELPKLVALHSRFRAKGLEFVTISCDEPEQEAQAATFIQKQGAPGPYYIRHAKDDDKFITAIDPRWSGALPALFLFDREGRQAASYVGETDLKQLEASIRKLLPG